MDTSQISLPLHNIPLCSEEFYNGRYQPRNRKSPLFLKELHFSLSLLKCHVLFVWNIFSAQQNDRLDKAIIIAIQRLVSTISHFHNCWQTYSDNINKAPFPSINSHSEECLAEFLRDAQQNEFGRWFGGKIWSCFTKSLENAS